MNLDAKKRPAENQYEVDHEAQGRRKAKSSGDQLFLMELEYAGIFQIENVPEDQLHPFLLIECPRMLFPFVRRIVSDVTRDGGFPPLNLENHRFRAALSRTRSQRRQQPQAGSRRPQQTGEA